MDRLLTEFLTQNEAPSGSSGEGDAGLSAPKENGICNGHVNGIVNGHASKQEIASDLFGVGVSYAFEHSGQFAVCGTEYEFEYCQHKEHRLFVRIQT